MTTKLFTAVMGTALLALAGCQSTQDKTPADTLVATFTSAAPNLAAGASLSFRRKVNFAMLLDQLRPFALETYDIALEGIDEADRAALMAALGRMRANLSRRQSLDAAANG